MAKTYKMQKPCPECQTTKTTEPTADELFRGFMWVCPNCGVGTYLCAIKRIQEDVGQSE